MGRWVNVPDVERMLQLNFTDATKPNISEVEEFIKQAEAEIEFRKLGTHSSDVLTKVDILPTNTLVKDSVGALMSEAAYTESGKVVTLPFTPIITVVSGTVARNKAALDDTADWDALIEGPGDSTDFIILQRYGRGGKVVGYALHFYSSKIPEDGYQRLRATWTYGHNIDSDILRRWGMLKAAREVIRARLFSGQPMNVATYTGGSMNTFVNTEYTNQISEIDRQITEIEERYFPNDPIGVAVM